MVKRKKHRGGFRKISLERVLTYVIITALLILIWSVVSAIVKALAFIYLIYRLVKAALEGFSNPFSVAHLFASIILVVLSFIVSSRAFLILIIILMWINAFLDD